MSSSTKSKDQAHGKASSVGCDHGISSNPQGSLYDDGLALNKTSNESNNGLLLADEPAVVHQHFKMYKPAQVLTQFVYTHRKRRKRTLLGDVAVDLPPAGKVMAIGRLDEDSEGLLLLTTNGQVSKAMREKCIEKEYWVQVDGQITEEAIERLQRGVEIRLPSQKGGSIWYTTRPCKVRILDTVIVETNNASWEPDGKNKLTTADQGTTVQSGQPKRKKFKGTCNKCGAEGHKAQNCHKNAVSFQRNEKESIVQVINLPSGIPPPTRSIRDEVRHGKTCWVSITVTEGKNRQIRRMTAAVGFPTLRLVRVRIGTIALDGMAVGEVRQLEETEIFNPGHGSLR